jgi:hypothetical protein
MRLYEEDIMKHGGSTKASSAQDGEQWTFLDDYQKTVQDSQ